VLSPGRRPYKTKDGWIGVLPYTERNWIKVLHEIGRADVCEQAWFRNATERSRRVDDLYDLLASALPSRTSADWLALFKELDIPSQPVRRPGDLLQDPHLADVDFFKPNFAPNFAHDTPVTRTLRQAVNVEALPVEPDLPPPALGADTAEVLRKAGCSEAEIASARAAEPPAAGKV
jgi:crotonobetainyl-CoA:carnitine CoA-transferase CaiB-like acyl-CoA transferase